jgi:hypothetical protein
VRPFRRVGIQTAADHFFHRGIDVGRDAGHAAEMDRVLQVDQLLDAGGLVGPFAGEEFVEHEA